MATTPTTSISSSYQRLGGSTPVITQGTPGPQLSAATQQRLSLEEQRKLDEEKIATERARIQKNIAMRGLDATRSSVADPKKALSQYENQLSSQLGKGQSRETMKKSMSDYSAYLKNLKGIV